MDIKRQTNRHVVSFDFIERYIFNEFNSFD